MKRVRAVLGSVVIFSLAVGGCGSYENRLDKSIQRRKEQAQLDQYLNPAVEGKFKEELIFLRTPKPLPGQAADFRLASGLGDEAFDLHSSFVALKQGGGLALGLHVLGRHKKPKPTGKNAPPTVDESQRGVFLTDVLRVLDTIHSGGASSVGDNRAKKKSNDFSRRLYQVGENTIEVYLISRKFPNDNNYDLALIWEIPRDQAKEHEKGIELCLQSLALGPNAARSFESGFGDDDAGGAGTEGAAGAF